MIRLYRGLMALALSSAFFLAPVAFLSAVVVTQTACPSSKDFASTAHRIVGVIDEAQPIFEANNLSTARLTQARGIAVDVENAFKNNQNDKAVTLVGSLIDVFQQIVADVNTHISNPNTRTLILVSLAVADIALHELSDNLAKASPAGVPSRGAGGAIQTIRSYRLKPKWRCRNSATGRFEKMEVCKAQPSTTTVETY